MSGASEQILPGSRRRGRRQHHEGYLHQELLRRHQGHHPADAIPQQGEERHHLNMLKYTKDKNLFHLDPYLLF